MNTKPLDLSGAVQYHHGQFPPLQLDYEALLPALEDAANSLGRYDEKLSGMINSALLLSPLRRQDAVSSSRMENTISTVEEIYRLEAEEDTATPNPYHAARNDDVEAYLYSRAMKMAEAALRQGQPFSEHLIRSAHQTLLSHGRGANKKPGMYKTEQNYIGDDRRRAVSYIPIAPEHLAPAMQALITFIETPKPRPLLRTAIAHVEFEALHPFEDGNGRIGRMLIPLMLWRLGVLRQPHFFVSGYFETHKDEYIERMRQVSAAGDWTGWITFFLTALHAQAQMNIATVNAIERLYLAMRERFRVLLNSQYHDRALDYIFANPVFRNDLFVAKSDIPPQTARIHSRRLVSAGLLRVLQPSSGRRAAFYAFDPLLDLLKV